MVVCNRGWGCCFGSLSLEGLAADGTDGKDWRPQIVPAQQGRRVGRQESDERGSLVSLTEEEQESDMADGSSLDSQVSMPSHLCIISPSHTCLSYMTSHLSIISPSHTCLSYMTSHLSIIHDITPVYHISLSHLSVISPSHTCLSYLFPMPVSYSCFTCLSVTPVPYNCLSHPSIVILVSVTLCPLSAIWYEI